MAVADSYTLTQRTVFANDGGAVYEYAAKMPDPQSFPDAARFWKADACPSFHKPEQGPVGEQQHFFRETRMAAFNAAPKAIDPYRP
jgi:hypothetical protein